jgi:uncharacterized protein (DUF924 family)
VIFDVVIHFNRDFQRNVNSYEFDQLFDFWRSDHSQKWLPKSKSVSSVCQSKFPVHEN